MESKGNSGTLYSLFCLFNLIYVWVYYGFWWALVNVIVPYGFIYDLVTHNLKI